MSPKKVHGKIRRLFVKTTGCNMWLDQQDNIYFELNLTHKNYNSLYALTLAAASNRWTVSLELSEVNEIEYIYVDYPQ